MVHLYVPICLIDECVSVSFLMLDKYIKHIIRALSWAMEGVDF